MRSFRHILLTALLTLGLFCAVLYVSCTKGPCVGISCQYGGTCINGNCTCPTGFTGKYCQNLSLIGTWSGKDACMPAAAGSSSIAITFNSYGVFTDTVLINNIGGFGGNIKAPVINGNTITYTNLVVNPSSVPDTLSGTITLTDSTHFTHTYTLNKGTTYSCTGSYTKL